MHGFASFREPTHVDFSDADFFALVGPTGSGKSTVIDAMTFALYGSVPRWDDKRVVALALAPTVPRGAVKLVFEVDGQRYVVGRELRRDKNDKVTQRAGSLERIDDPAGLALPGQPTTPMAKDLAGVTEAVERLLGLSYEDFIQCVVLPQGQFADFLHAKPKDRQDILLRLLGAEHYKQMMMRANQRAAAAGQRADTLAETMLRYADATDQARAQARAAEAALATLADQVTAALPRVAAAQAELAAAGGRLGHARVEHAALSGLRVPDGVGALDADLTASRAGLRGLLDAERTAESADDAARTALAAGPDPGPLLMTRDRRAERDRNSGRLPALDANAARLAQLAAAAAEAVSAAQLTLDDLRDGRDEAGRDAAEASEAVTRLTAEHGRLSAVSVPGGIAELDRRRQSAAVAVAEAESALLTAEQAEAAARDARASAVPEAPLAQASRDLRDLRGLGGELAAARAKAATARAARDTADATLAGAEEALRASQAAVDVARRAHVIAGLRPHLVAGEPCPLCEQPLGALPPAVRAPEVDHARSALAGAEREVPAARAARQRADTASATAQAALHAVEARQAGLVKALAGMATGPLADVTLPALRQVTAVRPVMMGKDGGTASAMAGPPDAMGRDRVAVIADDDALARALDEVADRLRARKELDQAAEDTAVAARDGRARHRAAQAGAERATAELSAARTALRAARDPLVELGAPPADEEHLAQAWATLTDWAREQARARAAELTRAREAAQAATGQHQRLVAAFEDAERSLARLRARAKAASGDDERARAELSHVLGRVAELDALLAGAPDEAEVTRQLALRGQLEEAAAGAQRSLVAARAARAGGEQALAALTRAEEGARRELSAARDTVVSLGAPRLSAGLGLLDDWTDLVTWASGEAKGRQGEIEAALSAVDAAQAEAARLTSGLSADLAAAGITLAPDRVATGAASAVAAALERARAVTRRIEERRAEAAALAGRQQAAKEEQQVSRLLGDLLRADHFQRWLVSAAVDELVAEASATLAALSGGQFEFAHHDGEFYVIDHADADARRSVRTLSGGETFQASLALALALSSQISALAATGAARLDSIFLDEGFGTLDPETLDTVAATLEALAQGQRMVGVVTHVQALAERVPVRFRVSRNAQTSTITREGLTAAQEMTP
jgi:exonuclease SbcC